jgi:hypothetical protein
MTTLERLEAADPLRGVDTTADADALRPRVLAGAPARRRRVGPALALAVAGLVAVALLPTRGGDSGRLPGPVAAFAAELRDAPLLHVRSVSVGTVNASGRLTPDPNPERTDGWYATDGSASRVSYLDGRDRVLAEAVRSGDEVRIFSTAQGGLIQRYEDPLAGETGAWLLALRRGDLEVAGQAEVRGRAAYEVRYDRYADDAHAYDHRAFVAVEGGTLLRIEALRLPADGPPRYDRTEVLTFEARSADPELLKPSERFRGFQDDPPARPRPAMP